MKQRREEGAKSAAPAAPVAQPGAFPGFWFEGRENK
jgi:hypothetical protein